MKGLIILVSIIVILIRFCKIEDHYIYTIPQSLLILIDVNGCGMVSFFTDTAYVRIFVTDVNDNAPAFSQPVYEISVEEDKEVGYVVITVTANDEDEGKTFDSSPDGNTRKSHPFSITLLGTVEQFAPAIYASVEVS